MLVGVVRITMITVLLFLSLFLGLFLGMSPKAAAKGAGKELGRPPQRIVSLNLCTDQLLMMLVGPSRIAAVSFLARQPEISVMAKTAEKLPITFGKAEEVFILDPDLVLVGSFTPRSTVNLLRKLNRNILEVAPATSLEAIARNIEIVGEAVGESKRAFLLISKLKSQFDLKRTGPKMVLPLAALYFANGYSSGRNTLADSVVQKAGFKTLGQKLQFSGTRKISLEALIFAKPEVLIVAQKSYRGDAMAYEVFKHPALRYVASKARTTSLATALTICGTPQTIDAVKSLAQFRKRHFPLAGKNAKEGD